MGDFVSKVGKLAATRNIAVLLTSQMTTRIKSETGAVMHPAMSGTPWDVGMSTRIVVFRDWIFKKSDEGYLPGIRLAGVMKAKGVSHQGVGEIAMFVIEKVRAHDRRPKALLTDTEWTS